MTDKVRIDELPISAEFLREKRLIQERGELALIVDGTNFKHLTYFSLNPGNHFRGGHYHNKKNENFYVVSGQLELETVDLETEERERFYLKEGKRVEIRPMCAHRFKALEYAQVIEYYDAPYDKDDDHAFDKF